MKPSARFAELLSFFAKIATAGAVLASVGAVCLHVSGYAAERTYLRGFGIDPDSFPRGVEGMMLKGYYSVIELGVLIVSSVFSWMSLLMIVYLAIVIAFVRWEPGTREPPRRVLALRGSRFAPYLANLSLSALIVWAVFLALFVGMFLLVIPGYVGESFGEKRARQEIQRCRQGCTARSPCAQIWKDEKPMGEGFVVATSAERLAFYDTKVRMVRLLQSSDYELRTPIQPMVDVKKPAE